MGTYTEGSATPVTLSTGVRRGLAAGSEIPVTLIPGDGIGREIAESVVGVFGGALPHSLSVDLEVTGPWSAAEC
jgi:hypothetical protein